MRERKSCKGFSLTKVLVLRFDSGSWVMWRMERSSLDFLRMSNTLFRSFFTILELMMTDFREWFELVAKVDRISIALSTVSIWGTSTCLQNDFVPTIFSFHCLQVLIAATLSFGVREVKTRERSSIGVCWNLEVEDWVVASWAVIWWMRRGSYVQIVSMDVCL